MIEVELYLVKSLVIVIHNLLCLLMILAVCDAINIEIFQSKVGCRTVMLYLILLCLLFAKVFL